MAWSGILRTTGSAHYRSLSSSNGDCHVRVLQVLFCVAVTSLFLLAYSMNIFDDSSDVKRASEEAARVKEEANVVLVSKLKGGIPGTDKRGWIMSPLHTAHEHGLGGATSCIDVHVGTIGPGMARANHRHHVKNESFLVWGAHARWRLENGENPAGYVNVELQAEDVTVFTAPAGRAHALANLDKSRTLFLVVCADTEWDPKNPDTDYGVWTDLKTRL